jgi:hypothetical protein
MMKYQLQLETMKTKEEQWNMPNNKLISRENRKLSKIIINQATSKTEKIFDLYPI